MISSAPRMKSRNSSATCANTRLVGQELERQAGDFLRARLEFAARVEVALEARPVGRRSSSSMQPISTTRLPRSQDRPVVSVSSTIWRISPAFASRIFPPRRARACPRARCRRGRCGPLTQRQLHRVPARPRPAGAPTGPGSSPARRRRSSSRGGSSSAATRRCPSARTASRCAAPPAQGALSASSAMIAAISSMRLLVVSDSPPASSRSRRAVAQQRGPAARTGIAEAGAIGVDFNGFHLRFHAGDSTRRSSPDAD